ncbi:MAG: twin-arginine translocation signal domain-containing protein [Pseudomonadota bacterium]
MDKDRASRRDFLKMATTAAPAAAVATVAAGSVAQADEVEQGEGLRMTDAAKKYYELARF